MSKSSNPYGLSLFEYKGSNFSGTQATYLINPTALAVNTTTPNSDLTGIKGGTNQLSTDIVGLCAGDLVTFGPSSGGTVTSGVPDNAWLLPTISTGYIMAANSLYNGATGKYNYPRAILGVFGGVQYLNSQNQNVRGMYWPNNGSANNPLAASGTVAVATVNDLADCIFQVQCGGSLGTTAVDAMKKVGQLCGFANNGSGNTSTGQSQLYLDIASFYTPTSSKSPYATDALPIQCAPFRLIGLAPIQGNSWTDPYPDVLVMINNHMWKPGQPA